MTGLRKTYIKEFNVQNVYNRTVTTCLIRLSRQELLQNYQGGTLIIILNTYW